ncbi:MAG: SusC/RagA family TonB-linked outer membrane protein [Gemmatimonadetes bacterium]|nr:SusC/RagA family TonB-linked outer membrane protein [Gemmatimonadota bacterium]
MRRVRYLLLALAGCSILPLRVSAQNPANLTGLVTDEAGQALPSAGVFIDAMNLGSLTNENGRYLLIVPAARFTAGQQIRLTAQLIGRASQTRTVTLQAGTVNMDFSLASDPLNLEEIVVTGSGTSTQRARLGVTVNSVKAEEIVKSNESNLVAALAGKAPNVEVTSSSGDPGAGAYIRIRGANSLSASNQPLFVVDGQPMDNSSIEIEDIGGGTRGTAVSNRAIDLNPNDIASVEILKGAAAAAIYGSRAASGVVLITTKSGRPGVNEMQWRSSISIDRVSNTPPLQTGFGQGMAAYPGVSVQLGEAPGSFTETGEICVEVYGLPRNRCPVSWGPAIAAGTPIFDHGTEIYRDGLKSDQYLSWTGGSETTTYYLSLGRLDNRGVVDGDQQYNRTTVRLRGSHVFRDDLRLAGNLAYTDGSGQFIQQGSNTSGIQLGALRTPPDFNNLPYLCPDSGKTATGTCKPGLHRTYRRPNPATLAETRGYDNPFWVAREMTNTADVGRTVGNVNAQYRPFGWLDVNYTLGVDYSADERRSVIPKSSADFPQGRMVRADLVNMVLDHNLVATARRDLTPWANVEVSLGQNLNQSEYRRYQVDGQNLIAGTDELDFTVTKTPNEYREKIRTDGYFSQASFGLWEQLYLTAGLRMDGSSTFGEAGKRFMYPKASAAWDLTKYVDNTPLSFAKARLAYGVAGKQPPVFSNVNAYATGTVTDGWLSPNGLYTIYRGNEGVVSGSTLGNSGIKPERTREIEGGIDFALFSNRMSLGLTYYDNHTTDAILSVDVPPSTGFFSKYANAAEFQNKGWEATAQLNVLEMGGLRWDVNANWGRNKSCVLDLAGSEKYALRGFVGSQVAVVAPEKDASGNITKCHQFGVFYTGDFVRFGRGSLVDGVNIDTKYPGWSEGDLYIPADGYPIDAGQSYVTGDANPDWTASFRNTLTIGRSLSVSGLVDVKRGGDAWNGTAGALDFFGTSARTAPYHGAGKSEVFGETFLSQQGAHGPGAGKSVPLNWATWFWNGIGSSFTGPDSQAIEDAGFVKLRDISVTYSVRNMDYIDRLGFTGVDVSVSGRNLKTWTDYTGVDPESNLTNQSDGRGIDYFNNPQTRSYVVSVTLTR